MLVVNDFLQGVNVKTQQSRAHTLQKTTLWKTYFTQHGMMQNRSSPPPPLPVPHHSWLILLNINIILDAARLIMPNLADLCFLILCSLHYMALCICTCVCVFSGVEGIKVWTHFEIALKLPTGQVWWIYALQSWWKEDYSSMVETLA